MISRASWCVTRRLTILSASATLARLHEELDKIAQQKDDLGVRLREATGLADLAFRNWTTGAN